MIDLKHNKKKGDLRKRTKKDRIVFQVTYNDNSMDIIQREELIDSIPKAGKIRILKAGKHESGDEMYVIEILNLKPKA